MPAPLQLDLNKLKAIDVHVHAGVSGKNAPRDGSGGPTRDDTLARMTERSGVGGQTPDETAEYYRQRNLACVIWGVDTGGTRPPRPGAVGNDEILEAAARNPDVLIPFAWIDVWREHAGADEAKRLIDAGVRGFKFHPPTGGYYANDQRLYELYEVIAAARLPALFHTGQTAVGQGAGAGGGVRLKYGNPIYLDDVAVDFPDMPIIMAHPSFPWQEEALAIALHKQNVYIDLSGWSPKYFPPLLVQYANTLLKNKVLFGSDHPMITADRWMADFAAAGFREEVQPLILKDNAARLFGLRGSS
jgi:predicted TIM-barrel fold metal-dependent hydrolase